MTQRRNYPIKCRQKSLKVKTNNKQIHKNKAEFHFHHNLSQKIKQGKLSVRREQPGLGWQKICLMMINHETFSPSERAFACLFIFVHAYLTRGSRQAGFFPF